MKNKTSKAYLVGGGIASLSAAVYLIKDGQIKGENIKIFDESKKIGGSLDAQNLSYSKGYVMRGIRMFEEKAFTCTFDLMSLIPSLTSPGKTIREEFIDFNKKSKSYSKSRLLKNGRAIDSRPLKLNLKDRFRIFNLLFRKESSLENMEIREYFTPSFFVSNFWYEFCTAFAFQSWHSLMEFRRYFIRFIQDFPSINTLETIEITPYNQYESLILPIKDWLKRQGVNFVINTKITDLDFKLKQNKKIVSHIHFNQDGKVGEIAVEENDFVFVSLGSIVANSSIGSMDEAPFLDYKNKSASWTLWENISKDRPEFGNPHVFNSYIDKSKWTSFTVTFRDPTFFKLIEKFIHKKVTTYGGINLIDSNWLMSIVLSYKPYFINQPEGVTLCWGYGLFSDKKGNFIKKKMSECNGKEILTELIYHLGFDEYLDKILKNSVCIPCMTPYVTSHFLPRAISDRPPVIPKNSVNLAFLGQYCEILNDVVFTVEYSVRSAQIAVFSLLKLNKKVSPIYKGAHHIKVLYNAFITMFR
ncbi:oleate hydratase [Candidatus Falkowbacteria bacterium RIFOXYB2_FULL_34_18]|uniref:Oleate hydratase n=1 Tax=Candidatus Falkowbacteria bacterium RIFOXYD2_FULL_34_120 TaxID=1798007 RepID=A0A1F5TMB7_9BACT|nr:MAG: oleate hydratase [Candidatus Falkowbacteria bacterium RIFOXYB2_FULL_34_18]OGF29243.1 MAG: oleate hydratase [Candidatus Falkowbacteria bacterium RIFOXYC12_FULL_34_55]OGF37777.1 MAG: oleate hydratase [Candidatus Falkowbacteria bacterium RIFOXYC2_FULL_34_220]OGF38765.1 MAG: oleate hydratase [Candidatus Falkowbacteria bacterium RIFOXYD12_FULL_34_57]OGF39999.1 MAG: oleate hydratase [Candidatus Falkowbacteria bacterium RIFOXYD2_FULL_34_120]